MRLSCAVVGAVVAIFRVLYHNASHWWQTYHPPNPPSAATRHSSLVTCHSSPTYGAAFANDCGQHTKGTKGAEVMQVTESQSAAAVESAWDSPGAAYDYE